MMERNSFTALLIASALALPAAASAQLTHRDVEYMNRIAQSMQSEMELARIAQTHATHSHVKYFADWLLTDNSRDYRRLQQLAHRKGVQLPTEPSVEEQGLAGSLAAMRDPEFSRRYLSHEIKDHRADERLTARVLRVTQDRQLRAFANYYLSSAKGHLRLAQEAVGNRSQ